MSCCGWILNGPVILAHPYMLFYLLRHCGVACNLLLNSSETGESSAGWLPPSKIKQSTESSRKQMTMQRDGQWPALMIQFLGYRECVEKISVFPDTLMILVALRHLSGEAPWEPLFSSAGIMETLYCCVTAPALLLQGNCYVQVTNQKWPKHVLWAAGPSLPAKPLCVFWWTLEGFVCLIWIWHYFCHSLHPQCPCSNWIPSSMVNKGSCYVK